MEFRLNKDLGLLCIRVGIGLVFMIHGYGKLMGGQETWVWVGSQMQYLGITFMPSFWGLLASCVEFFGGVALVTGFYVRYAAFLLAFVMFVAIVMHLKVGDPFKVYAHPLSLLIVFIGLILAGGGSYAVAD